HDNARPRVAQNVQKKLRKFDWEILSHPAYSPDIAPSDCHLFPALQHFPAGKKLNDIIEKYCNKEAKKFYSEYFIMTS
ncbi:Histone-lysine N-methyltransferase SETMAR, partial [Habropoda laboriosa]